MNRLLVTAIFLLSALIGRAQFYNFTYFSAPYQEQIDGTVLGDFNGEDLSPYIPVGFTFPYFSYSFDELSFFVDGVFIWNEHMYTANGLDYAGQLLPFAATFSHGDDTQMSYKTEGTPGHRIFKAQWKDWLLQNDTVGDNIFNIQMWLYEEDGAIEFRSGNVKIDQEECYWTGEPGGFTCLAVYDNIAGEALDCSITLVDSAQHPQAIIYYEMQDDVTTKGCIPSNFVYRFARPDAGIAEQTPATFRLFPNPATNVITIVLFDPTQEVTYRIYAFSGTLITTGTGTNPDISGLSKGTYLLTVDDGTAQSTQRFIKQ